MKKMIVIAALIGGMLMPAQMMASNDRGDKKPRVEYRNDKKEKKDKKGFDNRRDNRYNNGYNKNNNRPGKPDKVVIVNKPQPQVVVVNRPDRRPVPPPPPRGGCCDNDNDAASIIGAVGAFVGIVGLMSLIAQ